MNKKGFIKKPKTLISLLNRYIDINNYLNKNKQNSWQKL